MEDHSEAKFSDVPMLMFRFSIFLWCFRTFRLMMDPFRLQRGHELKRRKSSTFITWKHMNFSIKLAFNIMENIVKYEVNSNLCDMGKD